jgi:hypothetical protein
VSLLIGGWSEVSLLIGGWSEVSLLIGGWSEVSLLIGGNLFLECSEVERGGQDGGFLKQEDTIARQNFCTSSKSELL